MVVCLSTNAAYIEETLNSIKYANKARKITKQSNSISQDKLSTKEEFYKKRVFELEQECRHLKNVLKAKEHSKSRDNIKTMISYTQIEENTKNENLKDKFKDEERQFSELLEFLIENVEDVNVTKQNIIELDELIFDLNSQMNLHQQKLENEKNTEKQEEKLLDILQEKSSKLEDNLDIKEEAIIEVKELEETIEKTKETLKHLYLKKLGEKENKELTSEGFLEDKFILQRITSKKENQFINSEANQILGDNKMGAHKGVLDVIQSLTESLRPSDLKNKENLKSENFGIKQQGKDLNAQKLPKQPVYRLQKQEFQF